MQAFRNGLHAEARPLLAEARQMYERVYEGRLKLHKLDNPDVATALNNWGAVVKTIADVERAEAREHHEQALAIRERIYREHPDNPLIAFSLLHLGVLVREIAQTSDQMDLAISHMQRAYDIRIRKNGASHEETVFTRDRMIQTLKLLGRLEQARSFLNKALEDASSALGEDHEQCAQIRQQLSELSEAD